jgi:hypothetical protein
MVYKKYIKRNGKFYGPYVYNSRRVNGKVISEYQGIYDKKSNKRFIFLAIGGLLLLLSIFLIFNHQTKISGNVVSESNANVMKENVQEKIIYPKIHFTLISTQTQIENQSTQQPETNQSTPEVTTENSSEQINLDNSTSPTDETPNSSEQTTTEPTTETQPAETTSTSTTDVTESTSASTTDGIVSQVLETVSNFFLSFLNPTGMAVSNPQSTQVNAETSADESFTYQLKDGESVELLTGSVKTDSKDLPDNTVTLYFEGDKVLVKTNYSETVEENVQVNNTKTINQTKKIENINANELTAEEKSVLSAQFGNLSVEITKSELFNGRYIVRYELGNYNIEYSYDSDLSNETLKSQMESDKNKWLRDIVATLSSS